MKERLIHEAAARRHDKKRVHAKQVPKASTLFVIALVLVLVIASPLAASAAPTAAEIISQVRLQESQQQLDLLGQLRSEATLIPFRLTQTGPIIRYTFTNPPLVLQLRLGEDGSRLDLVHDTSTEKFSASRFDEKIGGTGVTYGDLAFSFLYWPDPQLLGPDSVRTRACWKLRLHPPARPAAYSSVLLWADQESGAIMRLEGYDEQNRLLKRFEVVSAQKIAGRWFLKQMRIEEIEPGTGKVRSRSYLEIKK